MNDNGKIGMTGIAVAMMLAIGLGATASYKVDPGYAGVVYNMDGGLEEETLGQGFHLRSISVSSSAISSSRLAMLLRIAFSMNL